MHMQNVQGFARSGIEGPAKFWTEAEHIDSIKMFRRVLGAVLRM